MRGSVFVHLDPRVDEVDVPVWLRDQPQLVLQVGLDLPIPIPDLRVDDHGVRGTLAFNDISYRCEVGWRAVYALVGEDGRGMVWPDSMPREIAAEVEREVGKASPDGGARAPQPSEEGGVLAQREEVLSSLPPAPRPMQSQATKPSCAAAQVNTSDGNSQHAKASGTADKHDDKRARRPLPPYLRVIK